MNIIITGCGGFLGRQIVERVKEFGDIIGLERKEPDGAVDIKEYIVADLTDAGIQKRFTEMELQADVMIHVAANIDMTPMSEQVLMDNCLGTFRMMQLALQTGCKKVIYISSIPVVGTPAVGDEAKKITEETLPAPETFYHVTKLAGEYMLQQLEQSGIQTAALRIPSPIGKGMSPRTILSVFLSKASNGETLTLLGKGTRRQNYIDARDIAEAIACCIQAKNISGVYNIASKETVSNRELAQKCVELTRSSSEIEFQGEDALDSVVWDIDTGKAKRELGFEPKYTLEDTIEWMLGK